MTQELAVIDAATRHGVAPLLARALRVADVSGWPPRVVGALDRALAGESALEHGRRAELRRLSSAFAAERIPALVFKGAAVAYQVYAQPWLRPRHDTDLLIRVDDTVRATDVLRGLGYEAMITTSGRLVSAQNQWIRRDEIGSQHAVDLHWRILNPQAFARLASFDELASRSVTLPALGDAARAPAPADALFIACLHRVAHHYDSENLLWLYDIHLLASSLRDVECDAFLDTVSRTGAGAVCAQGLRLAHDAFAGAAVERLERRIASRDTPAAWRRFMSGGVTRMDVIWSDLRVLDTWRDRVTLVREHLFPPASYMRARYDVPPGRGLPYFYAYRIAHGVKRWFRQI